MTTIKSDKKQTTRGKITMSSTIEHPIHKRLPELELAIFLPEAPWDYNKDASRIPPQTLFNRLTLSLLSKETGCSEDILRGFEIISSECARAISTVLQLSMRLGTCANLDRLIFSLSLRFDALKGPDDHTNAAIYANGLMKEELNPNCVIPGRSPMPKDTKSLILSTHLAQCKLFPLHMFDCKRGLEKLQWPANLRQGDLIWINLTKGSTGIMGREALQS